MIDATIDLALFALGARISPPRSPHLPKHGVGNAGRHLRVQRGEGSGQVIGFRARKRR